MPQCSGTSEAWRPCHQADQRAGHCSSPNEGMDNFLTRIAVEESSDFAIVSDMVAGRLRERVYVGDHGHV